MAVALVEALLGVSNERLVEVVAHQVDGAATEAAAHDARACDLVVAGYLVEEVQLLAADLIVLRQSFVRGVHQLADTLVVAFSEGFADS